MPHQCVRCNTFHEDGAEAILKGCSCGGRLFFYIKRKQIEAAKAVVTNIPEDQREQMEKDVFELVGAPVNQEEPVVLDFESIRVAKPGQYEIDLVHLFKNEPLIIRVGDGKYMLDLNETFRKGKEGKLK